MLDITSFKKHLTGLVEQSANPVSFTQNIPPSFIVAYSGGLDSHVLLHLLSACQLPCRAIYIDHGLQAESQNWSAHCAAVCQQLNIAFQSISVNAVADKGESPEASARAARYDALAKQMQPSDILLTAQHLQDQSETLLLQMLRTSGPAGLAAMPAVKAFAAGLHVRPLLMTERNELEDYARRHQLEWIEDPSNNDQRYDRNFFRRSIFPLLKKRWPSINQTLANVTLLQAEASELINDLAALDAEKVIDGDTVDIKSLMKLSAARQRNLIRYWLQTCGLDAPTSKRLKEILGSMITAAEDKMPVVDWADTEVRRFKGKLYAMKALQHHDPEQIIQWNPERPLSLSDNNKLLAVDSESGLSSQLRQQNLTVRYRTGGERIKPVGRAHTMDLKKLMQQAAIPPWQRNRIPLIYLDDRLIAVANYWVADGFKNKSGIAGWLVKTQEI